MKGAPGDTKDSGARWRDLMSRPHSREVVGSEATDGSEVAARAATEGSEQDRLPVDE